jgi:hypothetical protein
MDLIYTRAGSVYSCIDHTSNYEDLFRRLQGESSKSYTEDFASTDLSNLFSLRYFNRVWVIQEVALARAAYLLVNDDVLPLTAAVIDQMKRIYAHKELPSVLRWSLGQKTKLGVIACLRTSSSNQATDPRDRVFAVMGLMEAHAKSLIPVDYSLDLQLIYRIVIAAIIATRQKLDILLFTRHDPITPDARWCTLPFLNMEAFQHYLDSMDGSSKPEVHRLFTKPSPWCETITVTLVPPSDFCNASVQRNTSCFVEIPQDAPFGLLPRLRVRAHYIDSIRVADLNIVHGTDRTDAFVSSFARTSDAPYQHLRNSFANDARVTDCFKRDITVESKMDSRYDKSIQPDTDCEDLECFVRDSWRLNYRHRTFSSHFSVGFRPLDAQPTVTDEIFAIDGVKTLFILRRTASQQYRVVGECYLWAAWELDCWNPGTRKGRWGPSVSRPTVEQTRMIEIY